MIEKYSNPFQSVEILVPKKYKDLVHTYSQRHTDGSENKQIDSNPFELDIDLWFTALGLALKTHLKPNIVERKSTYNMAPGTVLTRKSWRVLFLQLLAIAETGEIEILDRPREMIEIAYGYANAGLPALFQILEEGSGQELLHFADHLESLFEKP